jgi:hypothetical protein
MEQKSTWPASIFYMLAWLICSLLIIVDVLSIREATLDVLTANRARLIEKSAEGEKTTTQLATGFTMTAVDQGIIFMGGVVAVVFAIGIEYYFRIGKAKGVLLKRVGLVLAIEIGIFVVCVLIQTFV